MERKKVKLRAVVRAAGWIIIVWGSGVFVKGFLDALFLSPDSEFISLKDWLVYARFEMIYGLVCLILGLAVLEFSRRVREYIVRRMEPPFEL